MLILSRNVGESIVVDGRIVVRIMRLEGDTVKVGIEAPAEVPVHRWEVYEEIQANNRAARTTGRVAVPKFSQTVATPTRAPASNGTGQETA